jgi:hypothetical protein
LEYPYSNNRTKLLYSVYVTNSLFMDEPQVHWEDQQKINRFSRLNLDLTKIEVFLKGEKEELSYLEDSISELELLDDSDMVE